MFHITPDIYKGIANAFREKVKDVNTFKGTIEYDTDEFYSTLHCTAAIYRTYDEDLDVIAFWWDYRLYMQEGEILTDFEMSDLIRNINFSHV